MDYNPLGRLALIVVAVLCIIFLRSPWKQIFVYPIATAEGKFSLARSIIRAGALLLTVLRSFNIQRIDGSQIIDAPQRHVLFLLDGSLSMSADDVAPNRFKQATKVISHLVQENHDTTYGLIVFSGLPVVRIPRSRDSEGIIDVISGMNLGDFPATDSFLGTALGDALLLSLQQFSAVPSNSKAIVVISDGDSNKGYDPYAVLDLIKQQNIPVYFVAIGEEGYEVGKDAIGLPVITSFDRPLMEKFTETTDGTLYENPDIAALDLFAEQLAATETAVTAKTYIQRIVSLNEHITPRLIVCYALLVLFQVRQIFIRYKK